MNAIDLPLGTKAKVWIMDEARFGLHTELRKVWIKRGVRPIVSRQTKYTWDYLYGALDVVNGEAHFLHLPSVSLEWNDAFLTSLAETDKDAVHIVIADQAGFHLRAGDARLPERVHIISLPPYSPELCPCEQLWDILREGICNQTFKTIKALRKALRPGLKAFWESSQKVLSLVGRPWLHLQANTLCKN